MADPMKGEEKPPAANFATTTSSTTAATNFEYDNETEWDVGIGDLIIDLDADIEKTTTTPAPSSSTILPPPSISSPLKPLSSSLPLGKQLSHHPHLGTSAGPASTIMAVEHSATVDKGLKMKIKRTQKPSGNKQHEIVKSGGSGASGSTMGSSASVGNSSSGSVENGSDSQLGAGSNTGSGSNSQSKKQSGGMASGSGSGTSVTSHRKGDKKSSLSSSSSSSTPAPPTSTPLPSPHCDKTGDLLLGGPNAPGPPAPPAGVAPGTSLINSIHSTTGNLHNSSSSVVTSSASGLSDLHDIRHKIKTEQKETADVCIGTSVGTITEPECLGPCEPGTSVTLEGIVWHETEGVLVVNVTWRGKTYVGTLLDCTRHDWAPPRFCDSPTSDLDSRTTKNSSGTGGGRTSKRGRNLNSGSGGGSSSSGGVAGSLGGSGGNGLGFGDLSNFTETRSSKLRNNSGSSSGGKEGRDGNSSNGNGNGGSSGKDAKSQRRTTNNSNSSGVIADKAGNSGGTSSPTPFVLPRPDKRKASKDDSKEGGNTNSSNASSNSSSDSKKSRSSAPPASPPGSGPVLLECPDPNCSKKYKHINGLRYHQSHAHGGVGSTETETENPASETETETHEGEEGRLQTFPSTLVDGTSEHVMRLPGETSGGVPPAVPPSPSASTPSSTPSTNSTPCNSSVSNSTSSVQGAPSGFKIKSPASLLTDVHSMADPNVPDTKSGPGGVAMTTGVDLSSSPSPHNKKKRKHDETLPLSATSGPVSTGGSAPVLDSPTPNSSTPGAPGPPSAIHPGREEPTSPAYSDISDDETRPGRYPNNEPMAAYYPPGTLQTGPGPVGPPVSIF
ncbi:hypothetical protein M8J77_013002 [Diaphorina citri]|nr:hypothetical protein M8J77_013002 [Diaphorina citri]